MEVIDVVDYCSYVKTIVYYLKLVFMKSKLSHRFPAYQYTLPIKDSYINLVQFEGHNWFYSLLSLISNVCQFSSTRLADIVRIKINPSNNSVASYHVLLWTFTEYNV